jgi:UDP-N-acetylglucosamine--N-acetylmuramyl-(pentapeptide) pyrophosphoryl-undecaprenol N-acetylglucosamine transferase
MPKKKSSRKVAPIILSAGGTGGHLFPAEALAEELLARGHKVVIFTDKRGHAFKSLGAKVKVHIVRSATLKPGIFSKLRAAFEMSWGLIQSFLLLRRLQPRLVVGFGGYPSFPGVYVAQLLKIPTLLHEQNAILGKANLWLIKRADRIALSLQGTRGIPAGAIEKCVVTGNPVRKDIAKVSDTAYTDPKRGNFNILITGGSQAASIFSTVVPKALTLLPETLQKRLRIVQQCRETDLAAVNEVYKNNNIEAETSTFFQDMPARLKAAHLFIGRSGASTVAEIAASGRPAIFVPYPGHKDQQQKHNADILAQREAAWVILQEFFTPEALAHQIQELMESPQRLTKAAQAAKNCGTGEAAARLADAALLLKPKP